MTWQEFKTKVESQGVKDSDNISWITVITTVEGNSEFNSRLNNENEWEIDDD